MTLRVRLLVNSDAAGRSGDDATMPFDVAAAMQTHAFHSDLPGYVPTPLTHLSELAAELGVGGLVVKDEAHRFGLEAFKALGASWAISRVVERSGERPLTFITATDGNHGRAVAWAAARLGHASVVYLPSEASDARLEAIVRLGAQAIRVEGTYDDAVERARVDAAANGWELLQDMAWPGYERVPSWVMQGYLTLIHEAIEQLGEELPTHVFVQCGVGSFAASVTAYLVERFGAERPALFVVEPEGAGCGMAAMERNEASPPRLDNTPHTFMVGLSCGQLSSSAWTILHRHVDGWVTCADEVARRGMRRLASPIVGDAPVVSGESGAVTTGLVETVCADPAHASIRERLGLDAAAKVLLISTEGATDKEIYRRVVT